MAERFVTTGGLLTINTGDDVATFAGALVGGRDREAASLSAYPAGEAPVFVGIVAAVIPVGVYSHLELPLVRAYEGPDLDGVPFVLVDGPAIASGAGQAAILSRYVEYLQQGMGLSGNMGDPRDLSLTPENSIFVDAPSRTIMQWRQGVLEQVSTIAQSFTPMGEWDPAVNYSTDALVSYGNFVFVSNIDDNLNRTPDAAPASSASWTWMPLPTATAFNAGWNLVFDALGSVIATGPAGDFEVPFKAELLGYTLVGDGVGSIVIDLWRDIYANFPPTVADSICASAKPTLSSAQKSRDFTLTGWSKTCNKGDLIRPNIVSCSGLTRVTLSLTVQRKWPDA